MPGSTPRDARPWLRLSVQAPPSGEELALVEALRALGARSVERDGTRFAALLPPPGDLGAFLRRAEGTIRLRTSLGDPWLEWRWMPREACEAAWGAEAEPRRVGDRLRVVPRGAADPSAPGELTIRVVPGPAFGDAAHPTTRAALRLLERYVATGDRIADVGCGSGILAVAAVRLGAASALALEGDPHAADTARETAEENGVGGRVEVRRAWVGPETLVPEAPFDGIVANVEATLLLPLLPALTRALVPDGWLVVSGVLRQEREAARAAALAAGVVVEREGAEEGWWSAALRRPQR